MSSEENITVIESFSADDTHAPVSYTHLDVYKRQAMYTARSSQISAR